MDKRTDIAMIGDRDSVLIGKAVGLGVFDETDGERANRLIYKLAREGCKVIFLTETFPAIIPIPDSHGPSGVAMAAIKANVEKAIGADILFSEDK